MQKFTEFVKRHQARTVVLATMCMLLVVAACDDDTTNPVQNASAIGDNIELSGRAFVYHLAPDRWQQVKFTVTHAPTPGMQESVFSSDQNVSETTEGMLMVSYPTRDGRFNSSMIPYSVDNHTGRITVDGRRVNTFGDFFTSDQLPRIASGTVTIMTYVSNELTVEVDNAEEACPVDEEVAESNMERLADSDQDPVPVPKEKKWVTDKDSCVESNKDGYPDCPDLTKDSVCKLLEAIMLKDSVTSTGDPTDTTNCHGWTFTCGKVWINNDQVDDILEDNGYEETTDPKPGDIVVYKKDGKITHSGHVQSDGNGGIKIESKWGRGGRYCHSPTAVPSSYGTPCYYKNDRPAPPGSTNPAKDDDKLKQS